MLRSTNLIFLLVLHNSIYSNIDFSLCLLYRKGNQKKKYGGEKMFRIHFHLRKATNSLAQRNNYRILSTIPPKTDHNELDDAEDMDDESMKHITKRWVQKWVYGLNLCPWSEKVLKEKKLRIILNRTAEEKAISELVESEAKLLAPPTAPHSTTLIILPSILSFDDFLDMSGKVESYLEKKGLSDDVQVASFHPLYQFENSEFEDVENYTSRSPFPMLHLLRVDDVSDAIESGEHDPEIVTQKNVYLMQKLGLEKVEEIHYAIIEEALEEEMKDRDNDDELNAVEEPVADDSIHPEVPKV